MISEHILDLGFPDVCFGDVESCFKMLKWFDSEPSKIPVKDGASVAIKKMFVNFYNRVREMLSKS